MYSYSYSLINILHTALVGSLEPILDTPTVSVQPYPQRYEESNRFFCAKKTPGKLALGFFPKEWFEATYLGITTILFVCQKNTVERGTPLAPLWCFTSHG